MSYRIRAEKNEPRDQRKQSNLASTSIRILKSPMFPLHRSIYLLICLILYKICAFLWFLGIFSQFFGWQFWFSKRLWLWRNASSGRGQDEQWLSSELWRKQRGGAIGAPPEYQGHCHWQQPDQIRARRLAGGCQEGCRPRRMALAGNGFSYPKLNS